MTTHHTLHEADPTYSLGDKRINRTGYGAMQLAGPDVFGPPKASVMPLRRWVPLAVGIPAAAGLALSLTGVVDLPDLSSALAHLSRRLGAWTYLLVAGLAFLETAAFVGLIAPGETALALGGVVAAHGRVSLVPMIAIAWAGAAGGDLVSFTAGGRVGRSALTAYGPWLGFTPQRLARVDAFFETYGAKAILVGRFIGVIRAIAPFLAASTGMRLRGFLPWSLLGTGLWSASFILVGYAFSASVDQATGILAHGALRRVRPGRIHAFLTGTAATLRDTERLVFRPDWRIVGAIGYLWFDIAVLWACLAAAGQKPPLAPVVLAYQIGYLSNLVPVPGGIGVLDGSMIGMLVLYGLGGTVATAGTLVYHAISLWVPAVSGTIAFILLQKTKGQPIVLRNPPEELRTDPG